MWGLLPRSKDIALISRTFKGQEYLKVQKHNFCPWRDFGWILFGFCIISQRLRNFHFQRREMFLHFQGALSLSGEAGGRHFTFYWISCMHLLSEHFYFLLKQFSFSLNHFYFSLNLVHARLQKITICTFIFYWNTFTFHWDILTFHWNTFTFHWILCIQDCKRLWFALFRHARVSRTYPCQSVRP